MRRADRLFQIIQHLRSGRLTTARMLSEALEVSERTIYRDIADLQGSGVPIDGAAGMGYLLRSGYDLPPLMFTEEELSALRVGARFLGAWGGEKMAASVATALEKIEAVLPDARLSGEETPIYALEFFMEPQERAYLDAINSAIRERQVLWLGYGDAEGAVTERAIEPLGLFFWGKTWTLAAWCRLRGGFRAFRPDRIRSLTVTGEIFTPAPGQTLEDYRAYVTCMDPPTRKRDNKRDR